MLKIAEAPQGHLCSAQTDADCISQLVHSKCAARPALTDLEGLHSGEAVSRFTGCFVKGCTSVINERIQEIYVGRPAHKSLVPAAAHPVAIAEPFLRSTWTPPIRALTLESVSNTSPIQVTTCQCCQSPKTCGMHT